MTSADVKYSFERCHDKATGAVNFEVFNDVAVDRDPGRSHGRHQDEFGVNAPFLSRLAENGAGAIIPQGSGEQVGQDPELRGPVQVCSTRVRPRGRACCASTTTGAARPISTRSRGARSDGANGPPHGSAHRRNAHDQRHPGRPDERGQGRRETPGPHLVPAQLGLRQHEL